MAFRLQPVGVGRALHRDSEGATVVVADVDVTGGDKTVNLIKDMEGQSVFIEADVSSTADAEKMVNACVDT